ncbi:TPA: glycosyltransferase family 4 protein [Bacillus paranthracis]
MKVLHLTSGLLFGGGLERVIVDLMTRRIGKSSYLCVINDQWDKKHLDELDRDLVLLCNRKIGTQNPIITLSILCRIYKFIKTNNIKIIHCHNSFSLKFGYLIKKVLKVKVIFTVHDTNAYYKELNKYPVDKYIAVSQSVYKNVKKYVPEDKIEVIYNGVDLKRFINASKYHEKNSKSFNIACVARIMPEKKGQDILIKALSILKKQYKYENFKCFFAGAIHNQESMDELIKLIKKLDLERNIQFMGNVEQIEKLYANTNVFVLPSRYEGFGLVVVEALASGCKVIVSKLDGPLEIIKENQEYGLYFEKENYEELAEKLYLLTQNVDCNKEYSDSRKILEYLKQDYSLEKMVERYDEVYREV